jgi:CRP-like cAMP-binding protein
MSAEVISLLKVHEYFQGVADEALHEVVQHARVTHYDVGSVVHEANVLLTTVGFVLRGRLKAVRVDARGAESLFRMIGRGEQFGLVVAALSEPVPVRLIALEPTTVLSLDYERALELTFRLPDLRRAWLTAYAGSQRQLFFGASQRRAPMMLALLHLTPASRPTAERLIARLGEVGEELAVFSNAEQWQTLPAVRFRQMYAEGQMLDVDAIRQQIAEWQDAERIIFDLPRTWRPSGWRGCSPSSIEWCCSFRLRMRPRSRACRSSRRRRAAGATRSASPSSWKAASPWRRRFPTFMTLLRATSRFWQRRRSPPGESRSRPVSNAWCTTCAACALAWRWAAGLPAACRTSACSRHSSSTASSST